MQDIWAGLHGHYKQQSWIDKPNIFAQEIASYILTGAKILELGAGQGQDTRFFAERGATVVSTDISEEALALSRQKLPAALSARVSFQRLDMATPLPFADAEFDVVYAHLSVHYFETETTTRLFGEIARVLKPGGIVAVLTNSTTDPEYGTGEQLEADYYLVGGTSKRYFSVESLRKFVAQFETLLLDDKGETYKDAAKGVHNLIRFVGKKAV